MPACIVGDPGPTLGREEDPMEEEMATHSSILAWKIPWMEELVGYSPWGRKESDMTEPLHFHFQPSAETFSSCVCY